MKTKVLIVLSALLFSMGAEAKLAGKNVVLVHGLKPSDLADRPSDSQLPGLADQYWEEYWGSRAEAKLYWPSTERVTGRVKDLIKAQIKTLEANETCKNYCIFVTHSAGDLVTRDALSRLGQWGVDPSKFKVMVVLDFAGAGGGSELADIAVNIAQGNGVINAIQKAAIKAVFKVDPTPQNIGVVTDLRPANARAIARGNSPIPRLRFVGSGSQYLSATKPFIKGTDDSVVGMHSTCGATRNNSYDSCSRSVTDKGVLKSVNGPSSLLFNHYPVLMGNGANHSEVIGNKRTGNYTTVTNNATLGGLRLDFSTQTKRKWWALWRKVRQIRNGDRKSMSANVYDTLNR